jgi:hypothetical protein
MTATKGDSMSSTDDQGNLVCYCGETAEYINPASDASPEHPCCAEHAKDGYRHLESQESQESQESAPVVPADYWQNAQIREAADARQERQERASAAPESAPELVNGCNLEACLTYAQERISALETERAEIRAERDSWQETAQVLDRELTKVRAELQR